MVIISTCGFIAKAREESVNTILEYVQKKEAGTFNKVFVTGCLSERHKSDLQKKIPNIDEYFGTSELPNLSKALAQFHKVAISMISWFGLVKRTIIGTNTLS